MREQFFKKVRRVVIKIGSSVLAHNRKLDTRVIESLTEDLFQLQKAYPNIQWVLVSSGAIPAGLDHLGLKKRPSEMAQLQALAAVGQPILMQAFQESFKSHRRRLAQILLTWEDLSSRVRYKNTQKTIEALVRKQVVPIINENDTVSTNEIGVGDNDQLSQMVAALFNADALVLLSDSDGFYADFKAGASSRVSMVDDLHASMFDAVRDVPKSHTRGGMRSKLNAIEKALKAGIACVLADGRTPQILSRLFSGEDRGTIFLPKIMRMTSKKHWIAYISKSEGTLVVDPGAEEAILKRGKSLLSKGIMKSLGLFEAGSSVTLKNEKKKNLGKGIINFSSQDLEKIMGLRSDEWEKRLGRPCLDEVIHRDNFVPAD